MLFSCLVNNRNNIKLREVIKLKQKFFKGDIAIISKNENFDIIQDIEVEIGDTFDQWGMTFKVVDMNQMCVFVEEVA